ncbi:MAG: hypothetical protein RLZZ395_2387 [Pseudomonadota bacterium]
MPSRVVRAGVQIEERGGQGAGDDASMHNRPP